MNLECVTNDIDVGAYSENPDRWTPDAFHYGEKKINTTLTRGAHFLKQNVAAFDANFYNLTKAEVESIDPQQRMVLEVAYESMESAGLQAHKLAGSRTGVFMASFTSDYREMLHRDPDTAPLYAATGTSNTSTSNRVSWFFDLRGPSFTVNTACSSSLVACHLACQSLWSGETESAIVGGTSLLLNPDMFMFLSNQQFLAPDGHCKSFDESGDGYARGEGTGVVILKRVADAVRDGDPIRAVIRGSGCNQDGHTKGFTIPSVDAQASLIEETYRNAGLSLAETRYVEAHGTGTQAGDTREMEGLSRTFSRHRTPSEKLLVGSVKTNIGHLEACAGLAALIKSVYILETGVIPPTRNVRELNTKIRWEDWHLQVPVTQTPWPTSGLRRISTQGFGYGGTNAHLILDDAAHYLEARNLKGNHYTRAQAKEQTKKTDRPEDEDQRLFLFQANDREGLKRVRSSLVQHLRRRPGLGASSVYQRDLAFTLASRRSHLQWQTFATASTQEELLRALEEDVWSSPEVRRAAAPPNLGFIFTGQGAQWARMGVELMAYPVYRESVLESDRFLREELGCPWSAVDELAKSEVSSFLSDAAYSQTLCSVLQIALVDLLEDWNISPTRVAGHSSGEITAAYCLGALDKHDSLRAAYFRGILSSEMRRKEKGPKGAMMAIGASPHEVEKYLAQLTAGRVVVACINSPTSVTASGDAAGIDELLSMVQERQLFGRKLQVDVAYHSQHMESIADSYAERLSQIKPRPAREGRTMYSSVLGRKIEANQLGASYWVRNMVCPVRFSEAASSLLDGEGGPAVDVLVEIGPHSALKGPLQQILEDRSLSTVKYASIMSRGKDSVKTALACAGELVLLGAPVAMDRVNSKDGLSPRPLVDLPPYPWNHSSKFWAESRLSQEYRLRKHARLPLLGSPCPTMGARERYWRGMIRLEEEPWVRDHKIQGSILYPAAGFLSMAVEAASQQAREQKSTVSAFRVRHVHLDAALVVAEDSAVETILQLRPHLPAPGSTTAAWMEFTVNSSVDKGPLRQNCSGLIMVEYEADPDSEIGGERAFEADSVCRRYQQVQLSCSQTVDVKGFYSRLDCLGLSYGPSFANVMEIRRAQEGRCVGAVRIPSVESMVPPAYRGHGHTIHPGTLDAVFHLAFAALDESSLPGPMVPTTIDELVLAAGAPNSPGTLLRGVSHSSPHGFREIVSDIDILDEKASKLLLQIKGFRCAGISGATESSELVGQSDIRSIAFRLGWKPAADLLSDEALQAYVSRAAGSDSQNVQYDSSAKQDDLAEVLANSTLSPGQRAQILGAMEQSNAASALLQPLDEVSLTLLNLNPQARTCTKNTQYIALLRHTKPSLSILELTPDSLPYSLFAALPSRRSLLQTARYTVRISQRGLEDRVKSQFGPLAPEVEVLVVDQGGKGDREPEKHDLILISNLSFSKFEQEDALGKAKQLLSPGGKIVVADLKRRAQAWDR